MYNIAVDYDGTITFDFEKLKYFLDILRSKSRKIIIWNGGNNIRQPDMNQKEIFNEMLDNLNKHNIPFDEIDDGTVGKFHTQVYIDDKCYRFENN